MAVQIEMRGLLTPMYASGDFSAVMVSMNLAAAGNREFVQMEALDGSPFFIATHNILCVREVEDEYAIAASE